ncbi:hypothetical protein BVC80_1835g21 [Macleaya cordata]|uniref:Josephin-like protein n=1 Tax=Macleaya cordata TaxID=56857 RepID=A0A200R4M7_MACCD|nr:hypothetical protein BVC80_1835g21 [Macleaya cordata]
MSMSSKACKRVNFSPDINEKPTISLKNNYYCTRIAGNRKTVSAGGGISSFRLPSKTSSGFSPMNFLRRLSAKMVRALRMVSSRRRRTSPKVSSSSSSNNYSNLERSRSYAAHHHHHHHVADSHRSEAIEDCIQFINSSSSFQRSNSVSAASS